MADRMRSHQVKIFVTLFVCYGCYAYNRKCVSFAMPKLVEEGLDKSHAGLIISSQNVAYAISKFLAGVLSDRISPRLLFTSGLLASGLATVLFACTDSVQVFTLLWFLNGFAQGCGWPSCVKMLKQWFSPTQFGTWWSVLSSSGNVSGCISPFVSAFFIMHHGWTLSLLLAGSVSIMMGIVSIFTLTSSPEDIGLKSFTASGSKKDSIEQSERSSIIDLLKSPFLWLVSFCFMVVICAKSSAVDWGQLYLMEDRKHSQYVASAFISSIESGGFLGRIAAGYLTDWALRKHRHKEKGNPRMSVAVYFMIGVLCGLHLLQFGVKEDSSRLWILVLGFFLGGCFYGAVAIYGIVASESAPPHLSGTAHALAALAANVGAITSGLPFSYVAKHYNWSTVFFISEITTGLTVFLMLCFRNHGSKGKEQKQN